MANKYPRHGIAALQEEGNFFRLLFRREFGIAFAVLERAERTGLFGKVLVDRLLDRLIEARDAV